jgi:hypothetical protein
MTQKNKKNSTQNKEKEMKKLLVTLAMALAPLAAMLGMAAPAHAEGILVCPSGHSGVATTLTSCPFADNVRSA